MEKKIIQESKAYLVEINEAEKEDGTKVDVVTSKREISIEDLQSRNTSIDADIVNLQNKITEAQAEKEANNALITQLTKE